jgi:cytochrome P450
MYRIRPSTRFFTSLSSDTISKPSTNLALKSFDQVPTPKESFLLGGSVQEFLNKPGGFSKLYQSVHEFHQELGPIFKWRPYHGVPYTLMVADPALSAKIFANEGETPQRNSFPAWIKYRQLRGVPLGLGNTTDPVDWKRWRSASNEKLLKPASVKEYIERLNPVAEDASLRVMDRYNKAQNSVSIQNDLFAYALEAVSAVVFGSRLGCLQPNSDDPTPDMAQTFIDSVEGFLITTQELVNLPPLPELVIDQLPAWKKHVQHSDKMFEIAQGLIHEKMKLLESGKDESLPDLVSFLLSRPELSRDDILTIAVDTIIAAVDTTSRSLGWLLYNIGTSSSSIQQRIRDEIRENCGDSPVTDKSLAKLHYLKACVKESLRLCPTVNPNMRVLPGDLELGGYLIPKNTPVLMSTWSTSRDPNIFENPNSYLPERWLTKDDRKLKNTQHTSFASLPFGFGPRMCAGRRLAETEMYLMAAELFRRAQVTFDPREGIPTPVLNIFMFPDREILFHIKKNQ